jgi:repressor LexA
VVGELEGRSREVLRLLACRESGGGEPPSVRDVARAAGYASSRSGQRRLEALEKAGLVVRGEAPSRKRRPLRLTERGWEAVGEIPALGRIAAGPGMEAVRVEEASAVARELFGAGRFLLEAAGQSMTGAGIEDGDQLLIVADPSPPDGTIVAALIGGERVTVKRLFREGENVRLRAENGEHNYIVAPAEDVEVQGRVELILRRPWRR